MAQLKTPQKSMPNCDTFLEALCPVLVSINYSSLSEIPLDTAQVADRSLFLFFRIFFNRLEGFKCD
jgi:hypothetical protein